MKKNLKLNVGKDGSILDSLADALIIIGRDMQTLWANRTITEEKDGVGHYGRAGGEKEKPDLKWSI